MAMADHRREVVTWRWSWDQENERYRDDGGQRPTRSRGQMITMADHRREAGGDMTMVFGTKKWNAAMTTAPRRQWSSRRRWSLGPRNRTPPCRRRRQGQRSEPRADDHDGGSLPGGDMAMVFGTKKWTAATTMASPGAGAGGGAEGGRSRWRITAGRWHGDGLWDHEMERRRDDGVAEGNDRRGAEGGRSRSSFDADHGRGTGQETRLIFVL